jgi:hypothetical protein
MSLLGFKPKTNSIGLFLKRFLDAIEAIISKTVC